MRLQMSRICERGNRHILRKDVSKLLNSILSISIHDLEYVAWLIHCYPAGELKENYSHSNVSTSFVSPLTCDSVPHMCAVAFAAFCSLRLPLNWQNTIDSLGVPVQASLASVASASHSKLCSMTVCMPRIHT